jgi:hypothetical protein
MTVTLRLSVVIHVTWTILHLIPYVLHGSTLFWVKSVLILVQIQGGVDVGFDILVVMSSGM